MENLVIMKERQAVTTSLQVAERFEKRHDNILRDVETLREDVLNFEEMFFEGDEPDSYNRPRKIYYMNRDGFTLLAMGFTGKEALKFKLEYINAFNKMEKFVHVPLSQEDIMIATLETQKALKKQVTSIASDVEELKTSIHVSASQRHSLKRKINSSVAKHLGGRHSNVYRGLAKKAYSEVYRQLWNYFNITSYAEVPKIKFDEAIQLIDFWVPSAEMRMEISAIQNQIEMEV